MLRLIPIILCLLYVGSASLHASEQIECGNSAEPALPPLAEIDGVFYSRITNNPVTGKYTAYHENGTRKEEGCLKDGKREGSFTYWGNYEEEVVVGTKTYKNGKLDGYWSSFVCTPKCCYEGWDGNYVNGENIRGWHWNFGCTKPVEDFVNNAD